MAEQMATDEALTQLRRNTRGVDYQAVTVLGEALDGARRELERVDELGRQAIAAEARAVHDLEAELDEARRERSGMQHLAQKNRTALDEARAALARRDTPMHAARELIEALAADEEWDHLIVEARTIDAVAALRRSLAALSAPVEAGATEPTQVGRCGATTGLRLPLRDHPSCELPAGHAGFHRDGHTEWGRSWVDPPEEGVPAEPTSDTGFPDRLARALHDADCGCGDYDDVEDPRYITAARAALAGAADTAREDQP